MEQLTIKKLSEILKDEISKGHGNMKIVISDDSEGNGYHGLYYGITPMCLSPECMELTVETTESDINKLVILG